MSRIITRITGVIAFILILVVALIVSEDELLEFLFKFHIKVLLIIGILFICKELWDFLKEYKKRGVNKFCLIWSLIFFLLLFINLTVFDFIVGPKLAQIEILYPEDGAEVNNNMINVGLNVRSIKPHIYIIVRSPQNALWRQADELKTEQFNDKLRGMAQLGELTPGIGQTFEIFAVSTNEDLPVGQLKKIPPDSIRSNIIRVKRIR